MPRSITDPQAVQTHLQIIQSVIQRMASNSASCKAWCIALVSAILVIVATTGKAQYTLIAIIPTVLFLILDTYYLALEKMFRQSYNSFIEKLHIGEINPADLYIVTPSGSMLRNFAMSFISFSIWPFYLTLLVMTFVVKSIVF
jgi:hypothetical protein